MIFWCDLPMRPWERPWNSRARNSVGGKRGGWEDARWSPSSCSAAAADSAASTPDARRPRQALPSRRRQTGLKRRRSAHRRAALMCCRLVDATPAPSPLDAAAWSAIAPSWSRRTRQARSLPRRDAQVASALVPNAGWSTIHSTASERRVELPPGRAATRPSRRRPDDHRRRCSYVPPEPDQSLPPPVEPPLEYTCLWFQVLLTPTSHRRPSRDVARRRQFDRLRSPCS